MVRNVSRPLPVYKYSIVEGCPFPSQKVPKYGTMCVDCNFEDHLNKHKDTYLFHYVVS